MRESGLNRRLLARVPVALLELLPGIGAQAWAVARLLAQSTAMLGNRRQPASRAAARLELVLQEVLQDDDEIARDGMLAAYGQLFDLVGQVDEVQIADTALAQQPDLLLDPQAVVALVERLAFLRRSLRARKSGISAMAVAAIYHSFATSRRAT